jgi:hypothetical protein
MAKKAAKKATPADAQIVMTLYDLRRESEMRKARNWFAMWMPQSFDDLLKLAQSWGTQENAWFRQVTSYWENSASLVLRGTVNKDLFFDWNHEMIFVYSKLKPFLKQMRDYSKAPEYLSNMEQLLEGSAELRKQVSEMQRRFKEWQEQQAKAAKA